MKIALLSALLLSATGQKVGGEPPTSDVSHKRVTATGSTTARALRDIAADVVMVSPATAAQRASGRKIVDFGVEQPQLASFSAASGAAVARDSRGGVVASYTGATQNQWTGAQVEGDWDLSSDDLFFLDLGFDNPSGITSIKVLFCFDTGTTLTNFASRATTYMPGILKPGRVAIPLLKSEQTVTGLADWTHVRRIEVRLIQADAAGTTAPDAVQVYGLWGGVSRKSKVLVTFDDGDDTLYAAAFPVMQAAGMRGTAYLVGSYVGTFSNVALAQLQEMYAAGWDLGNHTWSHKALALRGSITSAAGTATFTTVDADDTHGLSPGGSVTIAGADQPSYNGTFTVISTPDARSFTFAVSGSPRSPSTGMPSALVVPDNVARAQYLDHDDWLRQNGFQRGRGHLAYPKGEWDHHLLSVLTPLGLKTGRVAGTEGLAYVPAFHGILDPYRIPVVGVAASSASTYLASVDAAVANKSDVVLLVHKVSSEAGATTVAEFQALIDGLKTRRDAGQIDVVTISEWFGTVGRSEIVPESGQMLDVATGGLGAPLESGTPSDGDLVTYDAASQSWTHAPPAPLAYVTSDGSAYTSGMALGGVPTVTTGPAANLLRYSETFDNGTWGKEANATITADQDGVADLYTSNGTTTNSVRQVATTVSGQNYTGSLKAKRVAGADWYLFQMSNGGSNAARQWFNLATGAVGASGTAGTGGTNLAASIHADGAGYYRLRLSATVGWTTTYFQIQAVSGDGSTAGVAASTAYLKEAQLVNGDVLSPYVATTTTAVTTSTPYTVTRRAAAQVDSVAADVATLKNDFNALLAKLRAAGLLAP
jgi:hypothetical protein